MQPLRSDLYSTLQDGNTSGENTSKKERPWARTMKYYNPKLYGVYKTMVNRCYRKNATSYEIYGGRGIKVCEEWLESFDAFCTWALHNGHKEGLTLDRINVNGDYSPANCRFVSKKEQGRNRRTNRLITINGETRSVIEWAEKANLTPRLIYNRLHRNWPLEKLLIKPLKNGRRIK